MKNKKLKIAFIQPSLIKENIQKNQDQVLTLIQQALPADPHLILLPEIFLGGTHPFEQILSNSQIYQNFLRQLNDISREKKIFFYGSVLQKLKNKYFNTAVFITPKKIQKVYHKLHLFRFDDEHKVYTPGEKIKTFSTPWGKTAPLICYDLRFPELLRHFVLQGAKLALICAQWPTSRKDHWLKLLQARALENQIYILACNRIGKKDKLKYPGHSCVISPWGEIEFLMKQNQNVGIYEVNLSLIEKIRREYPFLNDVRKEFFRKI